MVRTREKFDPDELSEVLRHYDVGQITSISEFERGSYAAPKVNIVSDRGRFLLKRRPRTDDDPFRVAFAHSLQRFLSTKNFPLPHLIGTRDDNNSMLKLGDAIYELYEFIEGDAYDGGLLATYEAGKTLGIYHHLLKDFQSEYTPPRGHYHDAPMVYDSLRPLGEMMIQQPGMKGRGDELIKLLKRVRRLYSRAAKIVNTIGMPHWQSQIVHSDWHPGNVIYRKQHVVAVIDYDSARIRPRVMDVANGCLQFSMVTGGRDLSTWEPRTDVIRAKRFLRGYDEVNELTQDELRVVPHLMQEVLLAQAIPPIVRTGTFAGLDGFGFLQVMAEKMEWLRDHHEFTDLDAEND